MISLGSTSVGSDCQSPSPRRARRFSASTTNATLPTSDSVAPGTPRRRDLGRPSTSCAADHRRPATRSSHRGRSASSCRPRPRRRSVRRRPEPRWPRSRRGFTTTRPAWPMPDRARPAPECREAERCTEAQVDRVDHLRLRRHVVEEVGAGAPLGDRELVAPALRCRGSPGLGRRSRRPAPHVRWADGRTKRWPAPRLRRPQAGRRSARRP